MNNSIYVQAVIFWIACGFLGAFVGNRARRPGVGFLLGFIFGPLGLIASFALTPPRHSVSAPPTVHPWREPPIEFACHHCNHEMAVRPEMAGTEDTCPKCRKRFTIPRPRRTAEAVRTAKESRLTSCDDCGREISRRATACPHCGAPVS